MHIDIDKENKLNKSISLDDVPTEIDSIIKDFTFYNKSYILSSLIKVMELYPQKKKTILERISNDMENETLLEELIKRNKVKGLLDELDKLNAFIKSQKLPLSLMVYRGTSETYFKDLVLKRKNRYHFLTNFSTSLYEEEAIFHCEEQDKLLLEINLPKNYPCLWLAPFSMYEEEAEILLPSDVSFETIDKKIIDKKDKKIKKIIMRPI